jgi:signal transduction histidine kinase
LHAGSIVVALTSHTTSLRWQGPPPLRLLWIAVLIFVSVCGGLVLSDMIGRISAIWIANGILVYFLLKHPGRDWPAIFVVGTAANFFADLYMGDDIFRGGALTLCNVLGVITLAAPFQIFRLETDFSRPKPLCTFYALAVGPAPIVAGLAAGLFFHFVKGREFLPAALDWYATDALGYSIVVPILMTVRADDLRKMFAKDQIVVTLLLLGTMGATLGLNYLLRSMPIAFLMFPVVILVTFQRGFAGGSIALLMAGAYLMAPVLIGNSVGALRPHPLREQIILVQIFVAVTGFSVILVGAALAERRRLEQGLAKAIVRAETSREEALVARDAAERANRMKSMFLATMSHELRTPLNAIIGFSELMQAQFYGPHSDPRYREYSGLIESAGRHLLSLINDVLDMSKIEAGKFELYRQKLDAREIVRDCVELMHERAAQGGVSLTEDVPGRPLWINADKRAMKQILLNLLSNAIKFTPRNGRVVVRAKRADGKLFLSVEDSGIGIAADQLGRLGNPFVQVRTSAGASHEGTGLGLALVRALAEIHEGALKMESIRGRGTTATVIVPAIDCENEADALPLARSA